MFLFVIGHMLGNLKAFSGVDPQTQTHHLDLYAVFLREIGADIFGNSGFLWLFRAILAISVIAHFATVYQLRKLNLASRPQNYQKYSYGAASLAARWMWIGGLIIAFFIVYHILHFTTGDLHFYGFEHGAVYANIYSAFSRWYVLLIYAVAMLALSAHLYHGVWSVFQTLGINSRDWNGMLRNFALGAAVLILVGFLSVPVAIFAGLLPAPL